MEAAITHFKKERLIVRGRLREQYDETCDEE